MQVQRLYQLLQTPYECPSTPSPLAVHQQRVEETDSLSSAVGGDLEAVEGVREDRQEVVERECEGEEEGRGEVEGPGQSAMSVGDTSQYYSKPPDWALTLCVT